MPAHLQIETPAADVPAVSATHAQVPASTTGEHDHAWRKMPGGGARTQVYTCDLCDLVWDLDISSKTDDEQLGTNISHTPEAS
jgi:hypothetical protein